MFEKMPLRASPEAKHELCRTSGLWQRIYDVNRLPPPSAWFGDANFFLWEIIQKLFSLPRGFHILATQKIYFYVPEGFNGPWGLLAAFKTKTD